MRFLSPTFTSMPGRLAGTALLCACLLGAPAAPAVAQCERISTGIPLISGAPAYSLGFGTSVALSGDTLLVGEPGGNGGQVYVFVLAGGFWTQQATLPVAGLFTYEFGLGVALAGNTAVVADWRIERVSVFNRSGTSWSYAQTLVPTEALGGTHFGAAIAMGSLTTRSVAVVGAWSYHTAPAPGGAVVVFTINPIQVGATWGEAGFLYPSDPSPNDEFGESVAISGSSLIAGAPFDSTIAGTSAGSAYVFTSNNIGSGWTQQVKLAPSDAHAGDAFGSAVGISGDTAVVSAPNHPGAEAVYIFTRTAGIWSQFARLDAPYPATASRSFGTCVVIQGDRLVVGAPGASVPGHAANTGYIAMYARPTGSGISGTWALENTFVPSTAASNDLFGASITLSSTPPRVAAGSPSRDLTVSAAGAGEAFVLDITRPCPADFNCSGGLSVQDIFDFLAAWFAGSAAADFDGMNGIQVGDIFAFLSAWFAGC